MGGKCLIRWERELDVVSSSSKAVVSVLLPFPVVAPRLSILFPPHLEPTCGKSCPSPRGHHRPVALDMNEDNGHLVSPWGQRRVLCVCSDSRRRAWNTCASPCESLPALSSLLQCLHTRATLVYLVASGHNCPNPMVAPPELQLGSAS